jgi:hypothetical protein
MRHTFCDDSSRILKTYQTNHYDLVIKKKILHNLLKVWICTQITYRKFKRNLHVCHLPVFNMSRTVYSTFYEFYIKGLKMAILGGKKVARKKVYSLH